VAHGLTKGQEALLGDLFRSFGGGWFTLGQVCDLKGGADSVRAECEKALAGLIECGCISLTQNDGGTVYYNLTAQSVALKGA